MPILSGGTASLSLPLDLGPGLFQIDAHGAVSITPSAGATGHALFIETAGLDLIRADDTVAGTLFQCSNDVAFAPAAGEAVLLLDNAGHGVVWVQDPNKLGFYDNTPVVQPAAIPAPSGGAIQDAEARTAIAAILNALGAAAGGIGITA